VKRELEFVWLERVDDAVAVAIGTPGTKERAA